MTKESERPIFVSSEWYLGMNEVYCTWFECPKCHLDNPIDGTKYCRGCGCKAKFSPEIIRLSDKSTI